MHGATIKVVIPVLTNSRGNVVCFRTGMEWELFWTQYKTSGFNKVLWYAQQLCRVV